MHSVNVKIQFILQIADLENKEMARIEFSFVIEKFQKVFSKNKLSQIFCDFEVQFHKNEKVLFSLSISYTKYVHNQTMTKKWRKI